MPSQITIEPSLESLARETSTERELAPSSGDAQELLELTMVLVSKAFYRSPNLAHLLVYLCARYFNGTSDGLKEYVVGIEALGKPETFDPKKDSVVRVQIHRLRERLAEYYLNEGAQHGLRIEIPSGSYVPRFTPNGAGIGNASGSDAVEPSPASIQEPVREAADSEAMRVIPGRVAFLTWNSPRLWLGAFTILAAGAILGLILLRKSSETAAVRPPPASVVPGGPIRLLAGLEDGSWTDAAGTQWMSDRYFEGGRVVHSGNQYISGTHDQRLYQSRREGVFEYAIPLPPGDYQLKLYFAETYFGEMNSLGIGGESSRAFGVEINGETAIERLDVTMEAGGGAADARIFRDIHPAADGKLHLRFLPINNVPFINAIEITPGTSGKMIPLRLIERNSQFTDSKGNLWQPDGLVAGGQLVERRTQVVSDADPLLYQWRRFGNLNWNIPVVRNGTYTLIIHLAESWIRPDDPQGSGEGKRVFDILCNGVALQRDVDIFKRVGSDHALVLTFRGITPDHSDKIRLSFAAKRGYPALAALEVFEE